MRAVVLVLQRTPLTSRSSLATSHSTAQTYPKDEWYLKSLVVLVWALDTTHQGMITHTVYTYLITEYANPLALGSIVPTLIVSRLSFTRGILGSNFM